MHTLTNLAALCWLSLKTQVTNNLFSLHKTLDGNKWKYILDLLPKNLIYELLWAAGWLYLTLNLIWTNLMRLLVDLLPDMNQLSLLHHKREKHTVCCSTSVQHKWKKNSVMLSAALMFVWRLAFRSHTGVVNWLLRYWCQVVINKRDRERRGCSALSWIQ